MASAAQTHGSPYIDCPRGRWLTVENNNLHYIGLYAGDLVCVVPPINWPEKGPVLMQEGSEQRLCYAEVIDNGKCIRVNEGEGSWRIMPLSSSMHHLLGWVVRVIRYYEEPAVSLRLVERTEQQLEETRLNGTHPHRFDLQR